MAKTPYQIDFKDYMTWIARASDSQHAMEVKFNRSANTALGFLFAINGILFGVLASPATSRVFLFGPDHQAGMVAVQRWSFSPLLVLMLIVAIKTGLHFLYASVLFSSLTGMLERRYNLYRWIDYSITYALVTAYASYVAGLRDLVALLALAMVTAAIAILCLSSEVARSPQLLIPTALLYCSMLGLVMLPLCLGCCTTWSVWVYVLLLLLLLSGHGLLLSRALGRPVASFIRNDLSHSVLSLFAVLVLLWVPHT